MRINNKYSSDSLPCAKGGGPTNVGGGIVNQIKIFRKEDAVR